MRLSKAATKKVQQKKPPENFSPKIVQNISSPYIKEVSIHKFSSHHEVPVFEVSDYRALNQLIGYAKTCLKMITIESLNTLNNQIVIQKLKC